MGDKIAITNQKKIEYEGEFHAKNVFEYLSKFLEESRHFDVSVDDYIEVNKGDKKEISTECRAELIFTDYYKIHIVFKTVMEGTKKIKKVNGESVGLLNGKAVLTINSYIEPAYGSRRTPSALEGFLSRIYDKFFGQDELKKAIIKTAGEVGGLVNEFKSLLNTTY